MYFSVRPCLKRLSLEEKGALFEGILDYAQHGVWPDFDGILGVAWDFVAPLIDADGEAYKAKCEQAKRAVETRWARTKGDTDVYAGIRSNTEDTNNNINSNTITEPIPTPKAVSEGGMEGEDLFGRTTEPSADAPSDFEQKRRSALDAFNNHFGKATKEAVVEYALKHGRTEHDAASFYEYYSDRGWTCHGKPIDDWRGLFSAWKKRGSDTAQDPPAESELERLLKKHGARRWDGNNRGQGVVDNGGSLCFAMGGKLHIFPEEWLFVTDEKDWFLDQSIFYLEQELRNGRAYSEIVRDFC